MPDTMGIQHFGIERARNGDALCLASGQAVRGGGYLGAAVGGFFVMLGVNELAKKYKFLLEYKLAFSIIIGLVIAGTVDTVL